MNKKELYLRLIAGFGGAFTIIFSIVFSQWSYFALFLAITLITQREFYLLVRSQSFLPIGFLGVFVGATLFSVSFLVENSTISGKLYFLLFPLASLIFFIKLYKKNDSNPFTNIAFFFLGILYVALPLSLLNIVAFIKGVYSYQILAGLLIILWSSDTGAYFAGVNFGKTKLFERVSPKKSWEGSIGGSVMAIGASYILSIYFKDLELWRWIGIAIIIIIVGTYGDLVESMFKRSILIKDSGKTIPGHGGFLDRFDGLLLSVPFIVVFLEFF